ncbi:hypothetical protein K8M07_02565 [Schnuerera sp. xch1]|uniref:aconitase family protein n=1 Tax=Schnuerera sp. xch1 TaxID=2874283 RepID=UPI001CC106C5|nr:aconitase family protein [Schnuerera sp. xch1]MBZ2174123.1 hypothetical protein [Schnuerera sp. xch1]
MNIIYELLASSANLGKIKCGQEIKINVDLGLAHDGSMLKIIEEFKNLASDQYIICWDKLYVTVDHFLPAPDIKSRENYQMIKKFCEKYEIHLYDNGEGILHQVIVEKFGNTLKDRIIVGVDGHMCTSAGLGAIPFSITANEMVSVLTTGKYTLTVPKVIKIGLTGNFNYDNENKTKISGKDISLFLIKKLGSIELKNNAILLCGDVLKQLSESQKMVIGNMLGEIGAKTVYFFEENRIDDDVYSFDVSEITSFIVLPGSVENIVSVQDVEEVKISQVYIGGCTNGRLDDMEQVAKVLLSKKIHHDITLIICPASRKIANDMDRLGYSQIIRSSGGVIINPGCGACSGIHQGVISKEDIIVTTTPRNTMGRMGDRRGQIYLASPKVAAIFAIKGKITKI